jgi:hypothetical protein
MSLLDFAYTRRAAQTHSMPNVFKWFEDTCELNLQVVEKVWKVSASYISISLIGAEGRKKRWQTRCHDSHSKIEADKLGAMIV